MCPPPERPARPASAGALRRWFAKLIAALLVLSPRALAAQGLLAPAVGGEIGGGFEERTHSGGAGQSVEPERRLRYWFKLPLAGRLGDGRGLGYTITLRPSRVIAGAHAVDPEVRFRQMDYDAGLRVAGIPATNLSASLGRARARGERGGAPLSETDISSRSVDLALAFRPLPLSAQISERLSDRSWTIDPLAPTLRQSERTRAWRVSGQNTRTSLQFDRTLHDDRSLGFNYDAWSAALGHALRWGRSSGLQSALRRSDRDGSSPYREASLDERLHLQHLRQLSSDWSFARLESKGSASPVRTRTLGGILDHRALPWLTWGIGVHSYDTRTQAVESSALDTRARLSLEQRWAGGLRARGSGDAGVERRDGRGPASVSLTTVGESHTVGTSRSFMLDIPNPDSSSVVVRGVGPPTLYVHGVDFDLAAAGDRLEVRLTPASRIRAGETVEVDYRYEVGSRPVGRTITTHYQLSVEYGPIAIRHDGSTRDNHMENPATLIALTDERESRTEIESRWNAGRGTVALRGRHETRSSPRFDQRATDAQAEWSARWGARLLTSVLGGWNRRWGDGGRLDVLSGDARADWIARPWLRLGALIRGYQLARDDSRDQGTVDGSLDADLRVAAIDVALRYRTLHVIPASRGTTHVISAQLLRRF